MYAVFETGGKQYRASAGDLLKVEKLDTENGASVTFDRVMLVNNDGQVTVGAPTVANASVTAEVVDAERKDKKILIFKMKRRKTYRLKTRATPRSEVEKLLKVERDAFAMIDKLSKKLAEAEQALADAKGPLDMIPRALARSMAHDELDMAYVVQKSCVAQAEPVRAGHFVDLDGRSFFVSNRGEVVEDQGGAQGTFAAYVTN